MKRLVLLLTLLVALAATATPSYASVFCVSNALPGDNTGGSTWAVAKTTVAAAVAQVAANGDIIYVDSAHSEVPAGAITLDSTFAYAIISVTRSGTGNCAGSTWATGAVLRPGNGFGLTIAGTGAQQVFIYGMTLGTNSGSSSSNALNLATAVPAAQARVGLECLSCTIDMQGSSASDTITIGSSAASNNPLPFVKFVNTTFNIQSATTAVGFQIRFANVQIINGTIGYGGVNKPAQLFLLTSASNALSKLEVIDSDLSGFNTAAGSYFNPNNINGQVILRNLKLSATPALIAGTSPNYSFPNDAGSITAINVDSANTHTLFAYYNKLGVLTTDSTTYATTGATLDNTHVSFKIVTSTSASENEPFVTPPFLRWASDVASITSEVHVASDGTTFHNRNLWVDFEYLSGASTPQGTYLSMRNANPFDGSTVNWTTDTSAWTNAFGSPVLQKVVSSAYVPTNPSMLRARLHVGVASTTLYVDPVEYTSTGTGTAISYDEAGVILQPNVSGGGRRLLGQ